METINNVANSVENSSEKLESTFGKDKEIVARMRQDNYEGFKALVRMHLSFELDLNTDEFDLPCHEIVYLEKGKIRKWNKLSKKIKACTSGKFSSPVEMNDVQVTMDLIKYLRKLKEFLLKEENIKQEGIFRRTGAVSRQNELRSKINKRLDLDLDEENYTVHDCATVYKGYLADLSEPLLTDAHYPAHCQIAELCKTLDSSKPNSNREKHILNSVQLLLLLLPKTNCILMEDIITMLHTAAQYEKMNKMSPNSLATLFAPHLICPRNLPPEALHYVSQNMSNVISYMIAKGEEIFETPSKLATDIRAYFLEQSKKKIKSPEHILDVSISDVSTVNTVYTFVDREKTAAAHISNPTDTALAQLYAHIQSMPESSKKKKLIKQFNKENGQGTPLQLIMLSRLKNVGSNKTTKSISDSIKKRIFQRSIIHRTPKQSSPSYSSGFNTPNAASASTNSKVRVLFNSPIVSLPKTSTSTTKTHLLQKSVSSSSLFSNTSLKHDLVDNTSYRTKSSPSPSKTNRDLVTNENEQPVSTLNEERNNDYDKNLNTMEDIDNPLKTINYNTEDNKVHSSLPSTKFESLENIKLKYKSEPSLIQINCDNRFPFIEENVCNNKDEIIFTTNMTSNRNMCNLEDNITLDLEELSEKKLDSLSSILKRKNSDDIIINRNNDFESTPLKENSKMFIEDITNPKILKHKSIELITSTPSYLLGRKSMSPITKSTQRMPKSMQESIMTPRSRKPVMLTNTLCSLEQQNPMSLQNNLSEFREQDEDSALLENFSKNNEEDIQLEYQPENKMKRTYFDDKSSNLIEVKSSSPEPLSNTFREYLLTRSLLTADTPVVDSSFSSHSDDFRSHPEIQDLDEADMNESLLFCLNGNTPKRLEENCGDYDSFEKNSIECPDGELDLNDDEGNNEKLLLIMDDGPDETSL